MNKLVLIFLLFAFLISCKSDKLKHDVQYQQMPEGYSQEGMTQEDFQLVSTKGDHIDFIFSELPLSINLDGNSNILRDLSYLSTTAAPGIPLDCKPLARKIYLGNGEILSESDLYFGEGCYLQIFIKDRKPVYGNLLTAEGAQYYGSLLLQIDEEKSKEVEKQMQARALQSIGQ